MLKNRLYINFFLYWLVGLLLFSGCVSNNKPTSTAVEPSVADLGTNHQYNNRRQTPLDPKTTYIHIVKYPGESLSIIAAWYTGDLQNWKKLARANPRLNPSRIFIGNRIRIPKAMIKTYTPMPQEFVNKFIGKKSKKTVKKPPVSTPAKKTPVPETEQEDVPLLFGPK